MAFAVEKGGMVAFTNGTPPAPPFEKKSTNCTLARGAAVLLVMVHAITLPCVETF
jgi:hypothetical protein